MMRILLSEPVWRVVVALGMALAAVACSEGGPARRSEGAEERTQAGAMDPTASGERPRPAPVMRRAATPPVARRRPAAPPSARERPDAQFAVDPRLDLKVQWGNMIDRRWRRVTYQGAAGDRVTALYRRVRAKGRYPAVILGHGHGGDSRSMVKFFGESFKLLRVHLLAVDHPYHGHDRRVQGQDICAPSPQDLVKRFTRGVKDLRHAVRVLRSHPAVDPDRVGYLGFSLGGVLGGLLASHEPNLKAAALISPAGDWSVLAASNSLWKVGWNTRLLPKWLAVPGLRTLLATIDPAQSIRRFAPRPILFVVGRRDRVIRAESGLALARAAGKGGETWKHVGGHGPGRGLRRRAARWIAEQLYR